LRQVLSTERSRRNREGNGDVHKAPPKPKLKAKVAAGKDPTKKPK
jgi:hypothetical protein